jgi:hypothetical protein
VDVTARFASRENARLNPFGQLSPTRARDITLDARRLRALNLL